MTRPMRPLPPNRQLPGHYEPPMRPVEYSEASGTVTFRQALIVLRRRYLVILGMAVLGALGRALPGIPDPAVLSGLGHDPARPASGRR